MAAKVVAFLCRLIAAGVFLYAGAVKIWDFPNWRSATPQFFEDISNYQLLPVWDAAIAVAIYLPWLEVIAAIALFIPKVRLGALWLMTAMMAVFLAALGSAWWRDLDISCGCFGRGEANVTDFPVVITRDVALLAVILVALWLEKRRLRASRN